MTRDQLITMIAGLSLSDAPTAPFSEPAADAIETLDSLIGFAREVSRQPESASGQPPDTLRAELSGAVEALEGDSNDAEHDALYGLAAAEVRDDLANAAQLARIESGACDG